ALRERLAAIYTTDPVLVAAAVPLLALVAMVQLLDAVQAMCSFILRAYRITTLPMLVYVFSLWGVGVRGCWGLACVAGRWARTGAAEVAGACSFWLAAGASLAHAAAWLGLVRARLWRAAGSGQARGVADRNPSR